MQRQTSESFTLLNFSPSTSWEPPRRLNGWHGQRTGSGTCATHGSSVLVDRSVFAQQVSATPADGFSGTATWLLSICVDKCPGLCSGDHPDLRVQQSSYSLTDRRSRDPETRACQRLHNRTCKSGDVSAVLRILLRYWKAGKRRAPRSRQHSKGACTRA